MKNHNQYTIICKFYLRRTYKNNDITSHRFKVSKLIKNKANQKNQ